MLNAEATMLRSLPWAWLRLHRTVAQQLLASAICSLLLLRPVAPYNSWTSGRKPGYSSWQTIDCYSCMSTSYQQYWDFLKHTYFAQRNFTDACNDETFDKQKILVTPCRQICVLLKEPISVGGLTVGHQYVRGCYDKILTNGFNETAIETHRFRLEDHCRTLERSKLMLGGERMTGLVTMCSCWHSRCNGMPRRSAPSLLTTDLTASIALLYLLSSLLLVAAR